MNTAVVISGGVANNCSGDLAEKTGQYQSIGSFGDQNVGIAGNVVGYPYSAEIYENYYTHQGEYHSERYSSDDSALAFVDPHLIEGVQVRGMPHKSSGLFGLHNENSSLFSIEDPEIFWGMHNHESHERYLELTSHIPIINRQLIGKTESEANEIIKALRNHPTLGACASLIFSKENCVQVWKLGPIFELDGNGRHRVLAARENMLIAKQNAIAANQPFDPAMYAMPVKVIGLLKKL